MTTRDGEESSQLADHQHDRDDDRRNDAVANEETERTTILECATNAEEDTCADTSTDRDEDEVTWLERFLEAVLFMVLKSGVGVDLRFEDGGGRVGIRVFLARRRPLDVVVIGSHLVYDRK